MAKEKWYNSPKYSNRSWDDDFDTDDIKTTSYGGGYNYGYGSGYGEYDGYKSNWHYKPKKWSNYWANDDYWHSTSESLDEQLVIKSPEGYATPTKSEIANKGILSPQKDYWGREMKSYSAYDINDKSHKIVKNLARYFYHDMMGEAEDLDDIFQGEGPDAEHDKSIVTSIIEKVKDFVTPFTSPLDKSVYFYNKMKVNFDKPESKEDEIKTITQALQKMHIDEDVLNDKELAETEELVVGGLLGGTPYDPKIPFDPKDQYKSITKTAIIDKISLIKNWGESFKISKEVKKEVTYNSDRKELLPMTSLEQIVHMDLYNILMPDFHYKLATQNLHVNLPIKKEERKQKIIMLIDDSGSMNAPQKIEWVMALLTDRCNECRKDEAELFVAKFENNPSQSRFKFHHIHNEESFQEFIKTFQYKPCGGDTDIGRHIDFLSEQINKHKRLHNLDVDLSKEKVEILVVNDGQDSIKTKAFSYKTNAVSLYQPNNELKKLCLNNKGTYIIVKHDSVEQFQTEELIGV